MNKDFSICVKEACKLFDKSKRTVMWAIWKDQINARQSLYTNAWFISYQSCVSLWGEPVNMVDLQEIKEQLNG